MFNKSKKILAVVSMCLVILLTSPVAAQSVNCELPRTTGVPKNIQLEYQGTDGIWFRHDVAKCMLLQLTDYQYKNKQYALIQERLRINKKELALTEKELNISQTETLILEKNIEAAIRGKREAEEEMDSWYRHPALWIATGIVGTALTIYLVK